MPTMTDEKLKKYVVGLSAAVIKRLERDIKKSEGSIDQQTKQVAEDKKFLAEIKSWTFED